MVSWGVHPATCLDYAEATELIDKITGGRTLECLETLRARGEAVCSRLVFVLDEDRGVICYSQLRR